jgi:hypothetical protein
MRVPRSYCVEPLGAADTPHGNGDQARPVCASMCSKVYCSGVCRPGQVFIVVRLVTGPDEKVYVRMEYFGRIAPGIQIPTLKMPIWTRIRTAFNALPYPYCQTSFLSLIRLR